MTKIILTGDRPTGHLHVGHFVGSLQERVLLQNSGKFDELINYKELADNPQEDFQSMPLKSRKRRLLTQFPAQ